MEDIKKNSDEYKCEYVITRKGKTLVDKFGFVCLDGIDPINDEIRDGRIEYLKSMVSYTKDIINIELQQLQTRMREYSDIEYSKKMFSFDYEEETIEKHKGKSELIMWISKYPIITCKIDLTCQSPRKNRLMKGFTKSISLQILSSGNISSNN
jgi:hypothetical protein